MDDFISPSIDLKRHTEERRLKMHKAFESLPGVKKVYFQPPPTVRMEYPCIVYSRSGGTTSFSNDHPHNFRRRYTAIIIDPNPDSVIPDVFAMTFPMCTADRHYTADNLNHDVFTIYD